MTEGKIKAMFIFEILGRPLEHIKTTLEQFIDKLGEQKGIEIEKKTVHEPHALEKEEAKDLFTTFAEVELILDNLNLLFGVVLNMLPANVEVIEPTEFRLKNFNLGNILTDVSVKIHKIDEIAKSLLLERSQLINKVKEMQGKVNNLEKELDLKKEKKDEETGGEKEEKDKKVDDKNSDGEKIDDGEKTS